MASMSLKARLERLARREGLGGRACPVCPECGCTPSSVIVYEAHHADGAITYPLGEPCSRCGSGQRIEIHCGAKRAD
jgi:hypothetical protein